MNLYSENSQDIKNILRSLIYTSRFHDYENRIRIYKVYEKFNGSSLMNKLKFCFQIDQKSIEVDNSSWLQSSVDFFLNHFQMDNSLQRKSYSSKLMRLSEINDYMEIEKGVDQVEINVDHNDNQMIIDNPDTLKSDKFDWINEINSEISNLKISTLLVPIREIVLLGDPSISQKMWTSIFPQIWKIMTPNDQSVLTEFINEFLLSLTNLPSAINPKIPVVVKAMLDSLVNCFPMIKLHPEVIYTLAVKNNSWNIVGLFLEKAIISNLYRERSFHCLNKIFETLKEEDHNFGIKRYIVNQVTSKLTLKGLSFHQAGEFYLAEEIFNKANLNFKNELQNENFELKLNLNGNENGSNNSKVDLNNLICDIDCDIKTLDFGIWENSLIDIYKNTNK